MRTGLILAGHGSHVSANTAGVVWALVDQLRALGVSDEITAAFWKEIPSLHQAASTLNASDITIVPLFTARGYFSESVLPAEMGLNGPITERGGVRLRYARPLGEHPSVFDIVRRRVEQALSAAGVERDAAAIAVIGHGTKRSRESRLATEAQARQLREGHAAREVAAVFLDDTPSIPDIYELTSAPTVIAVPFFLAEGSHTTLDVPRALGLPPGATRGIVNGRDVLYTSPVGTGQDLIDLILDLARETGAELYPPQSGCAWDGFPTIGREALIEAVQQAGEFRFGQLTLTPSCVGVTSESGGVALTDPAAIRARVRENPFRPLPFSTDLPGGWHVPVDSPEMLHAAVETIYPGAVAAWTTRQDVTPFGALIARQRGMYRTLAALSPAQEAEQVAIVCGSCVRAPLWYDAAITDRQIPCVEACNVFLSRAKESLS